MILHLYEIKSCQGTLINGSRERDFNEVGARGIMKWD